MTDSTIDKLQVYYQGAIRNSPNDIPRMQRAIWASLYHMVSSDEFPEHSRCPDGAESWCKWKRAQALNEVPPSHTQRTTSLATDVLVKIIPIYKRFRMTNCFQSVPVG